MKLTISKQFHYFLKSVGLDLSVLLQKAEIPSKELQEELTLTSLEYYKLLLECDQVMTEENIRLLSQIDKFHTFIPTFFVAFSARNGLQALERLATFKKLVGPIEVKIVETERTVAVRYQFLYPNMELPKFSILNEQLLLLNLFRLGTGESIKPLLLESPYPYTQQTIAEFGIAPHLSKDNLIVFDKEDLQKVFLTENNLMWQYLEKELNSQLAHANIEGGFSSHLQKQLFSAIPAGQFSIDTIAHDMGLSTRTLQRNLSSEGTTFKKEVQMVQKVMAFSYLKMKVPIEEIAALLGYSEATAFYRAFKSWTGLTVTDYKKTAFTQ